MLTTISNSIIPMVIFAVVLYGCIKKTNVYEDFIDGAFDGMKIVVELVPTLIGLFVAVRILNDSGALGLITTALKPIASLIHTPDCVIPVIITKLFSSGSATSLMLNILTTMDLILEKDSPLPLSLVVRNLYSIRCLYI